MADPIRRWPALHLAGALLLRDTDRLLARLDDFEPSGIAESDDGWRVFFPSTEWRDRAAAGLAGSFDPVALSVARIDVDDEAWAERSQAALRAIRVGALTIAPPWDIPADRASTIVIRPSMGFGTGHHASTRLCLLALQRLPLAGRSVLDIGTGSGVLALAAGRLGAATATGVDNDEDAIQSARDNLALNPDVTGVSPRVGDFRSLQGTFDFVVANLAGALLSCESRRIVALVKPEGILVVSGFGSDEQRMVAESFAASAAIINRYEEEGWGCLVMTKGTRGAGVLGAGC